MRFSQRIGVTPAKPPIQLEEMSIALRHSIWNVLYSYFIDGHDDEYWKSRRFGEFAQIAEVHFFKNPIDDFPIHAFQYKDRLKKFILNADWHTVYDFVEWISSWGAGKRNWQAGYSEFDNAAAFRRATNSVLERENSAYRFVGSQLAPITNEDELAEVQTAASASVVGEAVASHVKAALSLMSDRQSPDYRNAIKESISAVEAAAKIVSGNPKATLADALKALEKTSQLHPALKEGFTKIYGWTSDSNGIRHAMMRSQSLTLADARFMLVTCSAFAHYLIDRTKSTSGLT